ncbi:hypothetical protein WR25_13436 [Diploscapter pachys]|uniref:Aquaporin n=1 Tax=Diploscapter pachys TaxID=2018661 RepID=A0A2A2KG84_9BILA|nr:hypothetical protein WR25_13436 [Diploscapter pachys]
MNRIGEKIRQKLGIKKDLIRELLAECLGTFFLVFIGNSANVQAAAAPGGNSTSCHIAWGIGFMFAVFMANSVSGAHLNPAISLAQFVLGNFPAWKVMPYTIAQLIGAYLGAAVTYFGHHDDLWRIDGGNRQVGGPQDTAGLFTSFPPAHMSIIGTAMLSGLICVVTDKRNRIPSQYAPVIIGSIMTLVAMTYGANVAFAINPARDLGPRLVLLTAGYGLETFNWRGGWMWWVGIVGPYIGALLGAWIYKIFVGLHGDHDSYDIDRPKGQGHSVSVPVGGYQTNGHHTNGHHAPSSYDHSTPMQRFNR